ncbi:MAG: DUF3419 family protein [Candidatus Staskawiczbacteria bacterium]|nr:DUF3419 family protein [Candidatus Staskawiczbacteria bacterium]
MNNPVINYSQCWEDPNLLNKALAINSSDAVLSITSGGDNTLFLLSLNPQKIVSIDSNLAQNYLLELKLVAAKNLEYDNFLEFVGVKESSQRIYLFNQIRNLLSPEANHWWADHQFLITRGVIHAGRFEKFLNTFQKYILPFVHSKKTVGNFVDSPLLQSQKEFYKNSWDSYRWRLLFKIATSRVLLKWFARQRGMFKYTESNEISEEYSKRLSHNLNSISIRGNYFMRYCLTGDYGSALPFYLSKSGYNFLRKSEKSTLSMVTDNLLSYLKSTPDNTFSKFNLSDIFEALSIKGNDLLWDEIVRTAKKDAIVVYWNNLVPRSYPSYLSTNIKDSHKIADELHVSDRVFFYGSFHINTIIK